MTRGDFMGRIASSFSVSFGLKGVGGVLPGGIGQGQVNFGRIPPGVAQLRPGNGPEQDYLSRYWADAPWTHIGVQYNFQLHQMFYALHPDSVHRAERVRLLGQPEEIKIVHYSGVEAAKPWHRILDRKWADLWPNVCAEPPTLGPRLRVARVLTNLRYTSL